MAYLELIALLNSDVELERWTTYTVEYESGCSYYDYTLKFRGKGVFTEEFELENFPFDEQALSITFSVLKSNRLIVLEANEEFPSTFVRSNFQMSNVFSVSHRDMVMTSKSYSSAKESASGVVYPRFTFSVVLQRQPMYYLTNIALPMMVLTYLGFLSFAVSFDGSRLDTSDRLSITLTLLLTAVAYKFVVASAIPQVSYLTLLDKYISLCFGFLCLIITENALFPFFETRPGWAVTGTHELYVFLGLIGLFTLINLVWFMRFSYKLRCRAKLCRDVNVVESVRRLVACSYPEVASQLRWTLVAAVLQRCEVDLRHSEEVQQLLGLAPNRCVPGRSCNRGSGRAGWGEESQRTVAAPGGRGSVQVDHNIILLGCACRLWSCLLPMRASAFNALLPWGRLRGCSATCRRQLISGAPLHQRGASLQ